MFKLTCENFIKAQNYIFANGDDINCAWFRYLFEGNDTEAFLNVLAKYQYENGGFGGIYYEFDYKGPCLKATEIAVKYILNLREKPSADHPLIQNMMKYILGLYRPEIGNWGEVVVPEVNNGVYCYWVKYRGEDTEPIENDEDDRIRKYRANEKVCFAAFVSYYSELVPEQLYSNIIKYPTEYILRYWDEGSPDYNKEIFDEGEPYDFEYFQWFVPCLKNKETVDKLTSVLRQNPTAFMELDFTKSDKAYVRLPCDVVGHPRSIVYPSVKKLVLDSLKYRMDQQSEDGHWNLGWSFGEDEKLQKLQVKYETYLTLAMLEKLGRFDMIERCRLKS